MGFVRQLTGADAMDRAGRIQSSANDLQAQMIDLSKEQFAFQKETSIEQRDYSRGLLSEDRALSNEDYLRRLGIVDELIASANFTPEYYDTQVGLATEGVRTQFDQAKESELRNMQRYGVTADSGSRGRLEREYQIRGAAEEANASNLTRLGLGAEERSRTDAAQRAGLSVSPQFVGNNTGNPVVGLANPAIDALGNVAADRSAQAAGWQSYGAQSQGAVLGGAALLGSAAILAPSDRRLKKNIVRIGTHPLGIGIYSYDIDGVSDVGVMADEVLTVMPDAVLRRRDGYLMVDYSKL